MLCVGLVVVLVGCERGPSKDEVARRTAEREAKLAARLAKPIEPRLVKVGQGELLVLDVPNASMLGSLPENQRCYVWRDTEFKTASIACSGPPELDLKD